MDGGKNAGAKSFASLGGLEGWWAYRGVAGLGLVLFGSILLNATLLIAFIRRPGLRTISNRFVMNLIGSNLLAIVVLSSLLILSSSGVSDRSFPEAMAPSFCAISEGSAALVTTSSILSVLLIGVDQYLAVVDPLRYRTRIDKLKCGLLILAVWFLALAFATLATLNPKPRSLSRLCSGRDPNTPPPTTPVTYGLAYALAYALIGYLVPFLAVCWIYASIYRAARNNSERTRRNGSRPVLSSGSFSDEGSPPLEDNGCPQRRLPKISSLSSIDENSEPVVFTMGTSRVTADDAKDTPKVPTAALRAEFLATEDQQGAPTVSRFPEVADHRRKSSHDLMYEEETGRGHEQPYEYEDSSDGEEAVPLSRTEVPGSRNTRSNSVNFDLGGDDEADDESGVGSSPSHAPLPIVTVTPPGQKIVATAVSATTMVTTVHRVATKGNNNHHQGYINNLKYKISNGSLFKYREETRAARISALVVVMGLICWTPYVYLLLARNVTPTVMEEDWEPPSTVGLESLALGFLVVATYVTPLLFGYRSRRVKRELRRFFCFKRELSYKNNRSLMAKKVLRRRYSGPTILGQLVVGEANEGNNNNNNNNNNARYSIFNCMYGRNRWPKEKVQFVQVPETALAVETCRSSFSSGASTQLSSTSTDECC
ncbi:histamine H1 receptor [Copidosoma floridanum]|uniref:histamine H1 receptor n=1 Tax=Copidosoma floridanum TaxID=29053 RepID=UPI0006C96DD5|nr:histamine H1 receptor [Copidosoma floridanum]XP_014216759.1 histamine H1 receptor [Copidosoma floridanum]XP_014216760.1 histamine H1 receptor [Copidosoma floridanum]XP_014216761.1 histamine H1 receptor [Copidosoma floridanum]